MTKKQAIKKSIAHWERMIEWVKKQNENKMPTMGKMINEINIYWSGNYCALCKKYIHKISCKGCPVRKKYKACGNWSHVNYSVTWKQWVIEAKVMLKQLRSLL